MNQDIEKAVRASDTERERVAQQISEATAEGRLSIADADERLERVYAATFRHELAEFVADLPQRQAPARPVDRFPTRLRLHAAIAVVVSMLLIARWAATDVPFFWPAGPMLLLWGSFLVHTRTVRFGGLR